MPKFELQNIHIFNIKILKNTTLSDEEKVKMLLEISEEALKISKSE